MKVLRALATDIRRIAEASESVAAHFTEVTPTEVLLRRFVSTMENPQSTDHDWQHLLVDAKRVLEIA